jgi:hypothetical protein
MKYTLTIKAITLSMMAGFGGCKQSGTENYDELIILDVLYIYIGKKTVCIDKLEPVVHEEIAVWQSLEVNQLIEDYENGKLKYYLKEMTAGLDDDSNPATILLS